MKNIDELLPFEIFHTYLQSISSIKFSPREIDVMACLIHLRGRAKMASLLDISERTIDIHKTRLSKKIGQEGSKELIVDFIEKSDKYPILKNYYFALLLQHEFEKKIKDIAKNKNVFCSLLLNPDQSKSPFGIQLTKHLSMAGILFNQVIDLEKEEICISWSQEFFLFPKNEDYYLSFFNFLINVLPELKIESAKTDFLNLRKNITTNIDPLAGEKSITRFNDSLIRCDLVLPSEQSLIRRDLLINEINESFSPQSNEIQIVALKGPGGAGKTTLARQYARLQSTKIVWEIHAENRETLRTSFEHLAKSLSITDEDKYNYKEIMSINNLNERERELLHYVKEKLKLSMSWFLLYDNVEKYSEIRHFLPQDSETWGKGNILITTRDNHIQLNKHITAGIEIGVLTSEEKLNLFGKITNADNKNSVIHELNNFLNKIPSFPLDVSLAAYFIEATHIPFEKYVDYLKNNDNEFEKLQKNLLEEVGDYNKTRYGIVTLSLDKIMKENAEFLELLLLISLLDSQNLSKELLESCKESVIVNSFIYYLKKYSLISVDQNQAKLDSKYFIHRSTQEIAFSYMKKQLSKDELRLLFNTIIEKLRKHLTELISSDNLEKLTALVIHYEMLLSKDSELIEDVRGDLETDLGNIYSALSYYEEALKLYEPALERIDQDKKIGIYLSNCVNQGYCHVLLNHLSKASNLLENALSHQEIRKPGRESIHAMGHLVFGNSKRWTGEYDQAISFLNKSIHYFDQSTPTNYFGKAMALAYLGYAYLEVGSYKKAQETLENNVLFSEKYLSEHSLRRNYSSVFLASVYRKFGCFDRAIHLINENNNKHQNFDDLKLDIISYHYFSYVKATFDVELAYCFLDKGEYKKAESILDPAFTIVLKHQKDSVVLSIGLIAKARVYLNYKDFKKSEMYLKNAMESINKGYGKNHFKVAEPLNLLGQICVLQDNLEKAEEIYVKSLKIYKQSDHPDRYMVLENLSDLYFTQSEKSKDAGHLKQKAFDCLEEAHDIIREYFPEDSPHVLRIENKIMGL